MVAQVVVSVSVSSPPSLSKIIAEFNGPHNLGAYRRGGAYVPNTALNSAISTSASALRISQFVGAARYVPMNASAPNVSGSHNVQGGTFNVGSAHCAVSGGNPSKSYSWARRSGYSFTVEGASTATALFKAPAIASGTFSGVYRCTVSDGYATTYTDITVTWTVF